MAAAAREGASPAPATRQSRRTIPSFSPACSSRSAGAPLALGLVLALAIVAGCGSGGSQNNPDLPDVVIDVVAQFLDVGQRFELDGSGTTDPNGEDENLEFQWRIVGGGANVAFDDHCRLNFDEICDANDDDFCSNDTSRFCASNADCTDFGTCQINSGSTSSQCSEGNCALGQGAQDVKATFLATVPGPFTIRLTAIGNRSNGTTTRILDTYPSLYVVGSLFAFGGTEGALVGEVEAAAEFAAGASKGASNPADGNLVLIDEDLGILRVFDLRTGEIVGAFGQSDRFVVDPVAMTFHPDNGRLYVAEADGDVRILDGTTGLLIANFGNVGASPKALRFSPASGDLLVVYGDAGPAGVHAFGSNGASKGALGGTAAAVTEAVGLDFLGDPATALLIADRAGRVVRCGVGGNGCGVFSEAADDLLEAGSPSAVAVNPSAESTDAQVLLADPVGGRVLACDADGDDCWVFGETEDIDSQFSDIFFAPPSAPTTSTTTTTLAPAN